MDAKQSGLSSLLNRTFETLVQVRQEYAPRLVATETGTVTAVSTGIARVSGLPGAAYGELIRLQDGTLGIAFNLDADGIALVLLSDSNALKAGIAAERTGQISDVPVGQGLLGRVLDPTARPLDGKGPLIFSRRMPIERESPHIMDRAPVEVPLQTGIKVIDALIPIGRGQRELILGDRQTGKTTLAVDAILNQKDQDIVCVYCAIGQRSASVAKVIADLQANGALEYTVVVVAEGDDAPGLRYIAPYAATTIAEYFMMQGRNVLIVYDDLTHHARAYRELALLLRRPPGREAFPGDIFYLHSRLLERSTHLRQELGGGSLTALPIIETEAQDISAYIPTNLISITDGQIYLSPDLFQKGMLPAVDVKMSVSRVGGKAQLAAYRGVAGALKLSYAQFEELESFARFGTRLDEQTRRTIAHGERIRSWLKQPQFDLIPVTEQVVVLLMLTAAKFDTVPLDHMQEAEQAVRNAAARMPDSIRSRILSGEELNQKDRDTMLALAEESLAGIEKRPQ
ncbi:MAG TPA: alternate F1F0 ATPase, F1 subunit alpha [Chthonomonadaceae bacterium]|nr:alternate F1F0 ATPase, F1 subunit alpha [Chthonomonadaceae bacterium]